MVRGLLSPTFGTLAHIRNHKLERERQSNAKYYQRCTGHIEDMQISKGRTIGHTHAASQQRSCQGEAKPDCNRQVTLDARKKDNRLGALH